MLDQRKQVLPLEKYPVPTGSWLGGVFAFYVGLAATGIVYLKYTFGFCLTLLIPCALITGIALIFVDDFELAFAIAGLVCSPVIMIFIVWIGFKFVFPLNFSLFRRVGWFLQKASFVSLSDTLGDVKHYEAFLKSDVNHIMEWLRGRN